MRRYKAFYNGKTWELEASSSYEAQQLAAKHFKTKKSWLVTVVLLDVPVDTASLG